MFAPSLDHPVINMCFYFAKTEIRSDFKCVFIVILKSCPLRGLVIILRFCRG